MNSPFKRLVRGVAALAVVGALAASATTSVFAFHQGYTQSSGGNAGPLNSGVSAIGQNGTGSITPGQTATGTANYTYTSASAPGGTVGPGTPSAAAGTFSGAGVSTIAGQNTTIGTMYQQWRHNTETNRWFYVYAGNANGKGTAAEQTAASISNPTFAYYYYTPLQGQKIYFSSQAAGETGTTARGAPGVIVSSSAAGVTQGNGTSANNSIVSVDAAGVTPMATILAMQANVPPCNASAVGQRCNASFVAGVRWGLAQEGFPAGSLTVLEAVESVALSSSPTGTGGAIQNSQAVAAGNAAIYADPWGSNGGAATLTLTDTAPVQSPTGVSNVGTTASPAVRFPNTEYTFQQTLTDTDNELLSGSLVFVFTQAGEGQLANARWFRVGTVLGDNNDNVIAPTGIVSCEYESWKEAPVKQQGSSTAGCGAITFLVSGNYVSSYGTAAAGTFGSSTGLTISHRINFSPTALGVLNVFGRGDDFHGRSSGNVLVGAISIQTTPQE